MTLDLEALKRVAEAAIPSLPFASMEAKLDWEDAYAEFEETLTPSVVLALLARVEAAERERDILNDLGHIQSKQAARIAGFVDGKAAGFREGQAALRPTLIGSTNALVNYENLKREGGGDLAAKMIDELKDAIWEIDQAARRALAQRDEVAG